MGIHAQFALANRAAIEDEIERLIALLDGADGDPDIEPEDDYCIAGDDGCGLARSMTGGTAWGAPEEEPGVLVPRYGEDQSAGPINFNAALRAYERRQRQLSSV